MATPSSKADGTEAPVPAANRPGTTVEIRLLGGFEVALDGTPCERFESKRTRGLLAYLACHADRALARDGLASLLWPEEDPAAARRNLRQAIYNLRMALGPGGRVASPAVASDHRAVRFRSDAGSWLDVGAFEQAVTRGLEAEGLARLRELARAAQLYRGDFLAGFHLEDSEAFEEWLVSERERLREAAIQALSELIPAYVARGDHRLAIRSARQRVELDPLSEEAHRELMRLYARSGRRERALAQFQDLGELLDRELGVRPTPETVELHRAIRDGDRTAPGEASAEVEPPGPFVPLVGRDREARQLSESFERTLASGARLALIAGGAGAGKTRLAKTAIHRLTSERPVTVLVGRCEPVPPGRTLQPFREALASIELEELTTAARQPFDELAGLLGVPGTAGAPAGGPTAGCVRRLPELWAELLRTLSASAGRKPARPVVVFLDDLRWADTATVELLGRLLGELSSLPVWFLATIEDTAAGRDHPVHRLLPADGGDGDRIDRVTLAPLGRDAVAEIAASLSGGDDGERLAAFLTSHGGGRPLQIVELINLLSDDGALTAEGSGRWELVAESGLEGIVLPGGLGEIILRRVARLPSSARRLMELAAVIGRSFEVGLLQSAADEHIGVVEIAIEQMIERWLVRQCSPYWTANPRERDLVLWARGARRGTFEFASYRIREAVYRGIDPLRRQQLHRQVAEAMGGEEIEVLAHHFERAGEAGRAVPFLLRSAERARILDDHPLALDYCRRARAALERAAGGGEGEAAWRRERRALESLRARLEPAPADAS